MSEEEGDAVKDFIEMLKTYREIKKAADDVVSLVKPEEKKKEKKK